MSGVREIVPETEQPHQPHALSHGFVRWQCVRNLHAQVMRQHAQVQGKAQDPGMSAVWQAVQLQVRTDQAHEEAGKQADKAEVRQHSRAHSSV